ncbi:MAG: hypothetical protein O3A82_06625 [Verrucomicrobia bacterium]|nr:hypothetical protein [Verrucomicrobiota bacterium]MDA1046584.1 hypothetical protein [Verrucomicrobiota bacterium]
MQLSENSTKEESNSKNTGPTKRQLPDPTKGLLELEEIPNALIGDQNASDK